MDFESVRLTDVTRRYGRRRAVSHVSLTLRSGDIIGLLGPNGAGKSTLLSMLATLTVPSNGTIAYGDANGRTDGADIRRRIGVLAHELFLYSELSARQNLTFFAELYGLEARKVVSPALTTAGLSDRADDPVSSFSRGMRQRLGLERALLHGPRLLLLDEPFTGLDDRSVATVSDRLRRLARGGTIVVLATHDLDVVDGLVTRLALVREGRLLADESAPAGVRARYRELVGTERTDAS